MLKSLVKMADSRKNKEWLRHKISDPGLNVLADSSSRHNIFPTTNYNNFMSLRKAFQCSSVRDRCYEVLAGGPLMSTCTNGEGEIVTPCDLSIFASLSVALRRRRRCRRRRSKRKRRRERRRRKRRRSLLLLATTCATVFQNAIGPSARGTKPLTGLS